MHIYVASSWRNNQQQDVVAVLRDDGHTVYDFRAASWDPAAPEGGFRWSDIEPDWQTWSPESQAVGLCHPTAVERFELDMAALREAQACVLVQPCGASAHLELGYAVGTFKPTAILLAPGVEAELMYRMCTAVLTQLDQVVTWVDWIASRLDEVRFMLRDYGLVGQHVGYRPPVSENPQSEIRNPQ